MNIKRKLGRQADDYLDQFENETFHQEVREELFPQPTPARKRIRPKQVWISFAATMAIACVVLVCCLTLLTPSTGKPSGNPVKPPEKEYFFENEKQESCSLDQINSSLDGSIAFDIAQCETTRKFDSISNDTLYYQISYINEDMLEETKIQVYTNEFYQFDWNVSDANTSDIIKEFYVHYLTSYHDQEFYFTVFTQAYITLDNAKIYVEYNGVSLDGQSNNFLQALAQIIK